MIPQTCKNTKLFTRLAEWIYTIINNILISLMRSVIYRGDAVCAEVGWVGRGDKSRARVCNP